MQSAPPIPFQPPTSAIRSGWICMAIGFLTFWILGIGIVFFHVSFVLAIVAMCKHQVKEGVILLTTSVAACIVCGMILITLLFGGILSATAQLQSAFQEPVQKLSTSTASATSPSAESFQRAPGQVPATPATIFRTSSKPPRVSPENPNPARRFD